MQHLRWSRHKQTARPQWERAWGSSCRGDSPGGEKRMFNLKGKERRAACVNSQKSGFTLTRSEFGQSKPAELLEDSAAQPSSLRSCPCPAPCYCSREGGQGAARRGLHAQLRCSRADWPCRDVLGTLQAARPEGEQRTPQTGLLDFGPALPQRCVLAAEPKPSPHQSSVQEVTQASSSLSPRPTRSQDPSTHSHSQPVTLQQPDATNLSPAEAAVTPWNLEAQGSEVQVDGVSKQLGFFLLRGF